MTGGLELGVASRELPAATPDLLAALAHLLAERGVKLRVSPAGELQLHDGDKRLSPTDRSTVCYYADPLADWIATPAADDTESGAIRDLKRGETPLDPAAPRCDRCGSVEFEEIGIHAGASIRRDCARCGRTWGFPVWWGDDGD